MILRCACRGHLNSQLLGPAARLFFWFFGVVYYIYYAASDGED